MGHGRGKQDVSISERNTGVTTVSAQGRVYVKRL